MVEFINVEELKAEAIKWIKLLEKSDNYDKGDYLDGFCLKHLCVDKCYPSLGLSWAECSDIPAVILFIKHFFNITLEDLE